jgi:TetR/AcrR family transcriptional regulator, mexJK operon transcriptional repressor
MKNLEDQETARARQKRGQILDAARRLFLSHGYAHTSTEAVRRAAGVSKETLYRYYATKEELFADILRRLTLEQLPKPLHSDDSLTSGADSKQLQRLVRTLAREISLVMMQPDYLGLLRVVIAESPRFPHLGELFKKTVPEQAIGAVSDLLKRLRKKGLVTKIDDEAAARMLLGSLLTYAILDGVLSSDGKPRPPAPKRIAAIADLFVRAVTDGEQWGKL